MRNQDISTGSMVDYLRKTAVVEAEEREFRPEEHILWCAADRLEDLVNLFLDDNIPDRLRTIAAILETKQDPADVE